MKLLLLLAFSIAASTAKCHTKPQEVASCQK